MKFCWDTVLANLLLVCSGNMCAVQMFPGRIWETRVPAGVGLSLKKPEPLRNLVGGHGCVASHGDLAYSPGDPGNSSDVASTLKPVLSMLFLFAEQEGKLHSADEREADFEPRLNVLNGGGDADMPPRQHSIGVGKNITLVGKGYYSFNWCLKHTDKPGGRLFSDAPSDTCVANSNDDVRMLWILPGLDPIVYRNDSKIQDHDQNPGNPDSRCNQAVKVMAAILDKPGTIFPKTTLGIDGSRFTRNGTPTFLYGISYYGALGASEDFIRRDLDDMQRHDFNWIRVWADWTGFGAAASAVDGKGREIPAGMKKLRWLIQECDRRSMLVDVTLTRAVEGDGSQRLQTLAAHRRAVETVITAIKSWHNWYLDLSNERNIRDTRFTSIEDLAQLRQLARRQDQQLLVTASHGGDISRDELRDYLQKVDVDFISPHRPRDPGSPTQTRSRTREYLVWMKEIGRVVPVHYQEPLRRGYANWNPTPEDFVTDLRGAIAGGAAGWCFHNGNERDEPDGRPRRSFDLREHRLFEQLDLQEMEAVRILPAELVK